MLSIRSALQLLFAAAALSSVPAQQQQQNNITYTVIASPESADASVVVVVDNTTWPLNAASSSSILYQGEAPVAQSGYHYAILDGNKQVNATEGFSRAPIVDGKQTVNEFFNRSLNSYQVSSLPQVLPPLPVINRVKSDLHIQGQIPTMHIWGNETAVNYLHQNQLEDVDVELNLTYIGLQYVQSFENVKVSLAGRSSRYVPKVSYGLKMKKKGNDNLFGYKNLKLRAFGLDPSYIREYIAFSTIKSVGLTASEFSYVRLFINNKPAGFYGLVETFQDPWLANEFAGGDEKYESGNLYQAVLMGMNQSVPAISDLSYFSNISYYDGGEYKIKAGPSKKSDASGYTDLQTFTKFVEEASNNTSKDDWEKRLDTEGFIRAMALENLLGFSDSYMTMADNYYMYSDPKEAGRMIYIPSDLDTTIGIALFDMDMMISGNYTAHPGLTFRPLTRKFFSYDYFSTPYQGLLLNLTQNLVSPTIMNPFIDSVVNMIHTDVEWDDHLIKMGKFVMPPVGNDQDYNFTLGMFPPGFRLNWTDVPQTFESSINGPTNSTTMESVKGFIARKSEAILAFYNQSKSV